MSGLSRGTSNGWCEAAADFQQHVAGYLAQGGMAVIASHQPFDVPRLKPLTLADYAP